MTVRPFQLGAYFHGVRLHAAVCSVGGACLALLVLGHGEALGAGGLAVVQEQLAPLPAIAASAGLLQSDPALRLVAATRTPLARLLLSRWSAAIVIGAVPPLAVHAAAAWAVPEVALSPLVWLAPLLFLGALALAASAAFASTFAGLGVAAAYWAASIVMVPVLQAVCAAPPEVLCLAASWSTSFASIAAHGPAWDLNRALLLGAAAALASLAVATYRNPERQLAARVRAEDEA